MAKPTEVEWLRLHLFEVVHGIEPFALETPAEFGITLDALIAAVLAEPTSKELVSIKRDINRVYMPHVDMVSVIAAYRRLRGA